MTRRAMLSDEPRQRLTPLQIAEQAPPPVYRDCCFYCETRGDVGCRHRRPWQ